ncbi:MAG TPA: winged helix-turn-helix domain-containing protein [Acidobacteriota bacterium]|nr:winged helix-turn-helix domain-containing protein [Acidobacteriota bacterium]
MFPSLNRIVGERGERLLEPKVMRVLQELARQAPEVVSRRALMDRVWPHEHVTEHVLSRCISELRKALADEARSPRYVETIRKGGYRLLCVPRQAEEHKVPSPGLACGTRSRYAGHLLWLALIVPVLAVALSFFFSWDPPRADGLRRGIPLTAYPGSELDPALSPDGDLLAFSWDGPGGDNFDIYLQRVGESSPRRLTDHAGEDKNPLFLNDGRIAFVRSAAGEEGIYAVDFEGEGGAGPGKVSETLLTRCNTGDIPDLALSSDGRYLYFSDLPAHGRPPSAVYRLDLQSGQRQPVTRPPEYAFGDRDLALSNDGKQLAFARAEVAGVEELFVTDLVSGRTRQLTFESESIMGLSWTPDDGRILFASSRDFVNLLWSVPADASGKASARSDLGGQLHDPYLSPASRRLVFEYKEFQSNIWSAQVQATGTVRFKETLAPSTRWDLAAAAASDGRVAFASTRSGYPALWTYSPVSGRTQRLTDPSVLPGRPSWSPDGERLVFSDRSTGQAELLQVSSAGGVPVRLTDSPHNEIAPSYSSDGRRIYFGSDQGGQWQLRVIDRQRREDGAVAASGGAIRGIESPDGKFLYFARHSRPGLWRKPLPEGPETLLTAGPAAGAWMEWTLGPGVLYYLEHTPTGSYLHSHRLGDGAQRVAIPGRLYQGGGMALTPAGDFLLTRLDRSESDILMAEWR